MCPSTSLPSVCISSLPVLICSWTKQLPQVYMSQHFSLFPYPLLDDKHFLGLSDKMPREKMRLNPCVTSCWQPDPWSCGRRATARISGRGPGHASSAEPGICQMLDCAALDLPTLLWRHRHEHMQVTQPCKVMLSGCRGRHGMFSEPSARVYVFVC